MTPVPRAHACFVALRTGFLACLYGVFWFKEITGRRNYYLLLVGCVRQLRVPRSSFEVAAGVLILSHSCSPLFPVLPLAPTMPYPAQVCGSLILACAVCIMLSR